MRTTVRRVGTVSSRDGEKYSITVRPAGHPLASASVGRWTALWCVLRWPWSQRLHRRRYSHAYNVVVSRHVRLFGRVPVQSTKCRSRLAADECAPEIEAMVAEWTLTTRPSSRLSWWRDATDQIIGK